MLKLTTGKGLDQRLAKATHYLRVNGETVEPSGLGLWAVNGLPQTPAEVIKYADDLRRLDSRQGFCREDGFATHVQGR